jgi:hypothetical protein
MPKNASRASKPPDSGSHRRWKRFESTFSSRAETAGAGAGGQHRGW